MNAAFEPRQGDWVRFQIKADRRVLEGFVQEVAESGEKWRVGRAPDSLHSEWFWRRDIDLLRLQPQL